MPHHPIHSLLKPSAIFWHPQAPPDLAQNSPGNHQPTLLCHFSSVATSYFKLQKRISIKTIDFTCKYWLGGVWQCPDCSCKGSSSSSQALNLCPAAHLAFWRILFSSCRRQSLTIPKAPAQGQQLTSRNQIAFPALLGCQQQGLACANVPRRALSRVIVPG